MAPAGITLGGFWRSELVIKKEMGLRPGGKVGVPFEARPIPASEDERYSLYWRASITRSRPEVSKVSPASTTHTDKGNQPEPVPRNVKHIYIREHRNAKLPGIRRLRVKNH